VSAERLMPPGAGVVPGARHDLKDIDVDVPLPRTFWVMESIRLDLGYGSQVHP
jgi:hypothetical protein